MINKIFQIKKLTKQDRTQFVPFVNERDFRGELIVDDPKSCTQSSDLRKIRNLAMIQNIKKSSKQHNFDKNYNKMVEKVKRMQRFLKPKEVNIDAKIDRCFEVLSQNKQVQKSNDHKKTYYIELKKELDGKLSNFKAEMFRKIKTKKQQRSQVYHSEITQKKQDNQVSRQQQNKSKLNNRKFIRRQLFGSLSHNSQLMADFSNQGLKYRHMVQTKKLDPWKKWYNKQEIQLFPGQILCGRRLQKSLY